MLRVISRLNVGGPAQHVTLLSGRLDPERYETLLVAGATGPGEESLEYLAEREGVSLLRIPALSRELNPAADRLALRRLRAIVRSFRPDLVHTHTAKAGALGRAAALLAGNGRVRIVHTYHGHVLEHYFGRARSGAFRLAERGLARRSDRLVGVSRATIDDLVRLGVADHGAFRMIPIGLDLSRFMDPPNGAGREFRREIGVGEDETLATFAARLVPIKRADLALQALAFARARGARVRLAVVGDGGLRPALERMAAQLGVAGAVSFTGYRLDMSNVTAASDVALLSSDSEGTPVSLIEAAAAGKPAVATAVGGVPEVVGDCGVLCPPGDPAALGAALAGLAADPGTREALGRRARERVRERYSVGRLLRDTDALYTELLEEELGG